MYSKVVILTLLGCVVLSHQTSLNCNPKDQEPYCLSSNKGTREELDEAFLEFMQIWVDKKVMNCCRIHLF